MQDSVNLRFIVSRTRQITNLKANNFSKFWSFIVIQTTKMPAILAQNWKFLWRGFSLFGHAR